MSDDEQPVEEKPPFQWSAKVLVILGVTLFMLTIPLALVCWSILTIFQPRPAPNAVAMEPPIELRQSLEKAADTTLKPAELGSEQRITVVGPDRVAATAAHFGTTAIEMEKGRYWVRLPAGRRESFIKAAQSGEKPGLIPAESGETELLEVIVQPEKSAP